MCLFLLTMILRRCSSGYRLGSKNTIVNHLLYLDDLKLYGRNRQEIESLVNTVRIFSDDICMEFGFDKCASMSIHRGKIYEQVHPSLGEIMPLDKGGVYKFSGVFESNVFDTAQMKTLLQQEFFKRYQNVLQTQLNAVNKVKGLNMFAVPVIQYSAALLGWTLSEITNIERKFRKVLTMHGAHHLKSDVDRLYLPRRLGGGGFISIADVIECEKRSFATYLYNTGYYILQCARDVLQIQLGGTKDEYVSEIRCHRLLQWKSKSLHGEFLKKVENGGEVSESFHWLVHGLLKMPTEVQIIATQDQALAVRSIKHHIYMVCQYLLHVRYRTKVTSHSRAIFLRVYGSSRSSKECSK